MSLEALLNEYDELHRRLSETYGASTGFGGMRNTPVTGLYKLRHEIAAEMREKRAQILEYGKTN